MKSIFLLWVCLTATVCFAGCFPYHLIDAPGVNGRVVDATSQRPVQAAVARYDRLLERSPVTQTMANGSFLLLPVKRWALYIPGEESTEPASITVEAKGYQTAHVLLR